MEVGVVEVGIVDVAGPGEKVDEGTGVAVQANIDAHNKSKKIVKAR
ncbi:MAG: hypothetical protein ACYDG5_03725 [Dehalococcoidales bacterium]